MDTVKVTENRNALRAQFRQKPAILNSKNLMVGEGSKNEIFDKLRIKLGKTKEEFQKIFELYNHLLNRQNP